MMDKIEEQVEELRRFADDYGKSHSTLFDYKENLLRKAADTIEALSTKLQAVNIERLADTKMIDGNRLLKDLEKETFTADLYEHGWDGQTVDYLLCLGDVKKVIDGYGRSVRDSGEMNKSILEVKTPKNCHECELCYEYRLCFVKTHDSGCCCGGKIMEEVPESGRPNWCPLKESAGDCGGWIPCSDRLPKKSGSYLVTTYSSGISQYISDIDQFIYNGMPDGYWINGEDVIAWQPLPELYHEP